MWSCGTCGDGHIAMYPQLDNEMIWRWQVVCGNGHEVHAVPGLRLELGVMTYGTDD